MGDPTLLYCVGATKAGTSWLYRALSDHPEARLRAVKEVHYWDTFEGEARDRQLAAFRRNLARYEATRAEAEAADRGWQVRNMDRRIADMGGLIEVLEGDREGDLAYAAWLMEGAEEAALVADMTPGYAVLPEDRLRRMLALTPAARVVYLIRDPLARLWSHVRMQAERQKQPGEEFAEKANNILWRILNKGHETHVTERGDYAGTIARLRRVVPEGRLMVAFAEAMFTPEGWAVICRFLGLSERPADTGEKVHEGPEARMREDLVTPAVAFLKDQYDWVAEHVGPLPANWQANLARVSP